MRGLVAFGGVLAGATAAGLVFAAVVMRAPAEDVRQLAVILSLSGAASLLVGAGAARWFGRRRHSLRLRFAVVYGAGLAITLINVLAAALLMFLNTHDLLLLLLLLGFSAVLSLLFGYAVTGEVLQDLARLASTARRLAQGDLHARTEIEGADEVARLGSSFDQMAERLQEGIERERAQEMARREMVAAVSHDLRTPLTTIRAMIEAIVDGVVADEDEVRRYITLVSGEVQHLSRLIDDLFELSQIESGALRLDLAPTRLPELLVQTLEAYEAPARDGGVTLEHAADPALPPVQADAPRLMRVLRNLIDNALRYTPAGGRVRLEARVEAGGAGQSVRVSVLDTGPGIPPEETERVFERFYRSARARTRADHAEPARALPLHDHQAEPARALPLRADHAEPARPLPLYPQQANHADPALPLPLHPHQAEPAPQRTTGAGLGLTIARGFVQAHGGRIWAESQAGAGAAFHFTLPLTPTAAA